MNHLAHLALVDVLLGRLPRPRRVVFISSATHDPEQWTGTPAPVEDSVFSLARRDPDAELARTAGMRRYATTKLLAVATSAALAREYPDVHVTAFDPGLLPGTRLARQHPAVVRACGVRLSRRCASCPSRPRRSCLAPFWPRCFVMIQCPHGLGLTWTTASGR